MSGLSLRAKKVLAQMGVFSPGDLQRFLLNEPFIRVDRLHDSIPDCGPKTGREIFEWYQSNLPDEPLPKTMWLRMVQDVSGRYSVFGYSETPRAGDGWIRYDMAEEQNKPET
jgi:hypothetical protein